MTEIEEQEELEANEFARCLLMPAELLAKDVGVRRKVDGQLIENSVRVLAVHYEVSQEMMRYRLIELGYISPL